MTIVCFKNFAAFWFHQSLFQHILKLRGNLNLSRENMQSVFSLIILLKQSENQTENNLKVVIMHCSRIFFYSFYLLFGCLTANFGPLLRGQHHVPKVNHCVLSMFDAKVTRSLVTRLGP